MLNRKPGNSFDSMHRRMRIFGILFATVWVLMLLIILGTWILGAYLQYECYKTQEPNSFACWYVSDRVEVGVRQR